MRVVGVVFRSVVVCLGRVTLGTLAAACLYFGSVCTG